MDKNYIIVGIVGLIVLVMIVAIILMSNNSESFLGFNKLDSKRHKWCIQNCVYDCRKKIASHLSPKALEDLQGYYNRAQIYDNLGDPNNNELHKYS